MRGSWEYHVVRRDARRYFEQRARRDAQPGTGLTQFGWRLQYEGQETHEYCACAAFFVLMPDWANRRLINLDEEGHFDLVGRRPQLLVAAVGDVGAQHNGASGQKLADCVAADARSGG